MFKKYLFLLLFCLLLLVACQQNLLLEPTASPAPPTATLAPTPTPLPAPYSGRGFDLFLAQVEAARLADRPGLIIPYMAQLPAAPLTDGNRAIFLWQGPANTVQVAGDMSGWDPATGPQLRHIEGSDLWVGEEVYEVDARLDYKFVIDGSRWALDPLNPNTVLGGFGPNSELAMPAYERPAELQPSSVAVPAGTISQHTLTSTYLNQNRTFFVYTPASQLVGQQYPSLYVHDGGEYISLINAPAILDWLIANGDIPPLIVVFVPPIEREKEYRRNDDYVRFMADELLPFVQAEYNTDPNPAQTGTLGASLGGLMAVYMGVTRPERFGLVAGQSGAYSLDSDAVINTLREKDTLPVRFYLAVGSYETAVSGNPNEGNLLAANQRLAQLLADYRYNFAYVERPEGHSWGFWQATFGDALRLLYGG